VHCCTAAAQAPASRSTGLSTLPTDAACQLNVLGHDGHTLGVDGAQVGVLKQPQQPPAAPARRWTGSAGRS
jgi:hypothetical protein